MSLQLNKMARFSVCLATVIVILFQLLLCFSASRCGPKARCQCDSEDDGVSMTCQNMGSRLDELCDFIGNLSKLNVTILHVTDSDIGHLYKDTFVGCESIRELILTKDNIETMEEDAFDEIENLTSLDLSSNKLDIYLSERVYKFPKELKILKLNRNKHHQPSVEFYPNLSESENIEILYMDGIYCNDFPKSYLKLRTLHSLTLSGYLGTCNMSCLRNTTFQYINSLTFLNISSCSILTVEAGTFASLSNLEVLDISGNMNMGFLLLSNVSYGLQFTRIKHLNYSKMHTTFGIGVKVLIKDFCYLHNTSLVEISIDSNKIILLETNSLILLPKTLKVLSTRDNIFTFGAYLLQSGCAQNVREYYGSFQNTLHDPRIFFEEEKIITNIENNSVTSNCPYMEENYLKKLSQAIPHCEYFEKNHVKLVLPSVPQHLEKIVFADCNMAYMIPVMNVPLVDTNLKYIDVSGNVIHSWNGPLGGPFENVTYLDLSRNYCDQINPKFFSSFRSLETLHVDQNFIGLILVDGKVGPYIFGDLRHLKTLTMSANKITFIPPKLFTNNTNLEVLDLSVNNIEKWTLDTKSLANLRHLNLSYNFISTLPRQLTNHFTEALTRHGKNFSVDLSNNTIVYSCNDKEFLKWLVTNKANMIGFDKYHFKRENDKVTAAGFVKLVKNMNEDCKERFYVSLTLALAIFVPFAGICIVALIASNRKAIMHRLVKFRNPPRNYKASRFKAFISFDNDDRYFVHDVLALKLESEYKQPCCLHERDFKPGTAVRRNIAEGIQDSENVVVVLTNSYLTSDWCRVEFEFAVEEILHYKRPENSLIVILKESLNEQDLQNNAVVKHWCRKHTCLSYSEDEQFWKKLCAALNIKAGRSRYGTVSESDDTNRRQSLPNAEEDAPLLTTEF